MKDIIGFVNFGFNQQPLVIQVMCDSMILFTGMYVLMPHKYSLYLIYHNLSCQMMLCVYNLKLKYLETTKILLIVQYILSFYILDVGQNIGVYFYSVICE